tara:strand:- start:500 stop:697 length:198 start_codon:yes stop_codon:yes gene_type:complete
MKKILEVYYPVILAFICMLYSIGLGMSGNTDEAQYTAHWPGTILLFAIAIRQRRKDINSKNKKDA